MRTRREWGDEEEEREKVEESTKTEREMFLPLLEVLVDLHSHYARQ